MINVEKHIGLVHSIAKKYKSTLLEYEDIVGYGMIGLVEAARKFDETLGYKFSTYATFRIRGEICRAIRDKSGLIGSREDKQKRNAKIAVPFSLLTLEGESNKDIDFEISVEDTTLNDIIENLDIRQAMNKLSDIEKEVLIKRYWEEKTQRVISNELGLSQAEISRRLKKALNNISLYINAGGIAN